MLWAEPGTSSRETLPHEIGENIYKQEKEAN